MTQNDDKINRREFFARTAKAGASIAAVAGLGYLLHDAKPPTGRPEDDAAALPDWRVTEAGARMAIIQGSDRAATVRAALSAIGGIGAFVRKGDRVLLKVNAAFATPAMLGATAHPDVVGEVARLCVAAGAAEVVVTDNPINDPQSCFALSGIGDAASRAGAKLVLPREGLFGNYSLDGGRLIRNWPTLLAPLRRADKVIGISPVKHHERAKASMSLKNWYGLLGGGRNRFHQDINGIIRELAMLVRPTLVVLDGTTTMMTNGPTGGSLDDLKATNTMIVSTDGVAADAFGATLLGLTAGDLPYIAQAAAAGAGTADYESMKLVRAAI